MGVCIYANNSTIEFYGGYSQFFHLRRRIASAIDFRLGDLYDMIWSEGGPELDKKINKLLKEPKFKDEDSDVFDFLFEPDTGGYITHKTCKKIYELIKDKDYSGKCINYIAYSDGTDYESFKKLLMECYSHRRYLRWD